MYMYSLEVSFFYLYNYQQQLTSSQSTELLGVEDGGFPLHVLQSTTFVCEGTSLVRVYLVSKPVYCLRQPVLLSLPDEPDCRSATLLPLFLHNHTIKLDLSYLSDFLHLFVCIAIVYVVCVCV